MLSILVVLLCSLWNELSLGPKTMSSFLSPLSTSLVLVASSHEALWSPCFIPASSLPYSAWTQGSLTEVSPSAHSHIPQFQPVLMFFCLSIS